jgi:hypothetical protein
MSKLITSPNLDRHDELYECLLRLHSGLDEKECQRLDARLILVLMNHIGNEAVILEAFRIAALSRQ